MNDIILITAATGNIGSELVALLASDPNIKEVRVGTRNPQSSKAQLLRAFAPHKVKPVAFDITDGSTLEIAFTGVSRLCLIAPLGDDINEFHQKTVHHATKAGVGYIVKVSVDGASAEVTEGPGAAHWVGEQLVRRSGLPSTMLRPTIFMQHFLIVPGLYSRGDKQFYLPTGQSGLAFLDCRDIAYAAYKFLTNPSLANDLDEDYLAFTGPAALSGTEIAEQLTQLTGKQFTWEASMKAFEKHSKQVDSPLELSAIYGAGAKGAFAEVKTDTFASILGRQPNSFAKFAFDNQYYFSTL